MARGIIEDGGTVRSTQPLERPRANAALMGSGIVLDLSKPMPVDPTGRAPIIYRSGTATVTRGNNGRARCLTFASQPTGNPVQSAHVQIPPVVPLAGQFTLLLYCRPTVFNNDGSVYITGGISAYCQDGAGSGPALRWGQGLHFPSRKQLRGIAKIGGIDVTVDDGTDCVEGTDYVITLVYDGAALRMYKHGVQVASAAASGSVEITGYTALIVGDDYVNSATGADGFYGRGFSGDLYLAAVDSRAWSADKIRTASNNPWQLFDADNDPVFYSLAGGSNNTATLNSTLEDATLVGVGSVTRSGTLSVTLDASTLAGIGGVSLSGALATTLADVTLTGLGAVTVSGTLNSTLEVATLAGVGSVAVGANRDGTLAVTLDNATLAGIGGVTRTGTLSVTLEVATLAGVGTAGQPRTGTLSVTLDNVTLSGIGAIPAAPSQGGGTGKGQNLSRKQKKKLKAVESQEWLKAEETARQLLNDRFTKQTPQEKAEALQTYVESLQPIIEALKALTEPVEEAVEEPVVELTPHQEILTRFDTLEKKLKSVEELVIILMADL